MRRSGPMIHLVRCVTALTLSTSLALLPAPVLAQDKSLKEQQIDYAKELYQQGEEALGKRDYKTAVAKFEEAYRYAPDLHVFNFNIANAAFAGGNCAKAKTYFQRFLDTVPDHPERTSAQEKLLEIERSGCAVEDATPGPAVSEEDPLAAQAAAEAQEEADEDAEAEPKKPKKPKKESKYRFNKLMKIGLGVGGGGLLLGAAGGVLGLIAWNNARKLAEASGEDGPLGFSPNEYDDATYKMDVNRQRMGLTSYILMPVGVAALGTGLALYFIGLKKCKAQFKAGAPVGPTGQAGPVQARLQGVAPAAFARGGGVSASVQFGLAGRRAGSSASICD